MMMIARMFSLHGSYVSVKHPNYHDDCTYAGEVLCLPALRLSHPINI